MIPRATILITTRNRSEELRKALASCVSQSTPVEILVIDDASTDGTSDMVRREFPAATVVRSETALGYIIHRNRGAAMAKAPIVISIDDDAAFSTDRVVEQTLRAFDHPRVGAVAIPYIDVGRQEEPILAAPDDGTIYVASTYIGTAHAIRRDLFLKLGGYPAEFFHMDEERDYCTRMLQAGYVTRVGWADLIHHFVSSKRDYSRPFIYRARNHLLYTWRNVPLIYLPLHAAGTVLNLMKLGIRRRHPLWILWGIVRGAGACVAHPGSRHPVSRATYLLNRRLQRRGKIPLAEVLPLIEPMAFADKPAADQVRSDATAAGDAGGAKPVPASRSGG